MLSSKNKEAVEWMDHEEWYFINADNKFELKKDAPQEIRKSFELYRRLNPHVCK